ncbi:RecQ family ATP-dependent DNA helicase [Enterococcus quebecensis]|uniref:ATP-dependent DNA helicase RecQ n=1 Tax=Enterococcus quebecensis TaxID=903983 RepID=A0A1E5GQM4_9ENTE|nr:RecQ family ATP-dependent DNA helicase [Enterococcus quebecensis]OEG14997.1 recombinase RecQ [Enterococcus quebecensis]OJG74349.1 RecQ family ATP-dependent DNA helicase [Enterococcus quebecensis]
MSIYLEQVLYDKFGFNTFKPGQKEVIELLLTKKDTLAVLPTGTGKSLCYQFIGQLVEGTVIIVSPLLSLMEDQVIQLQKKGESRVIALNSSLSFLEKQYVLNHLNDYKFILVSPETLMQKEVRQKIAQLMIALFVVDEAHCVSQWGVDFRPEYTKLDQIQEECGYPLTLALTATATKTVKKEILKQVFTHCDQVSEVVFSVNRPNIGLIVNHTTEKNEKLIFYLNQLKSKGIIYCATRKKAEILSQTIKEQTNLKTAFYHGGLSPNDRSLLQQQFVSNQLDVLCATNAFGMGIDKPDIRFVIHYDCPDSLENYVQEIGRAGRDGQPSVAILLYQKGDEYIHYYFQEESRLDRELLHAPGVYLTETQEDTLPALNEIQQKWLQGFLKKEYTIEELEKRLLRKEKERQQQLNSMLNYINEEKCRRELIQQYFSEKINETKQENCCDQCGLSFDNYKEQIVQSPEENEKSQQWEDILIRLFKE